MYRSTDTTIMVVLQTLIPLLFIHVSFHFVCRSILHNKPSMYIKSHLNIITQTNHYTYRQFLFYCVPLYKYTGFDTNRNVHEVRLELWVSLVKKLTVDADKVLYIYSVCIKGKSIRCVKLHIHALWFLRWQLGSHYMYVLTMWFIDMRIDSSTSLFQTK